jgi:uncharacterized protein YkwD
MYRITNLMLLLIGTLFILPASAVMQASGSPQNSDNDDNGGGSSSSDDGGGGGGSSSSDTSNDGSSSSSSDNSDKSGTDSSMDNNDDKSGDDSMSMDNNDDKSGTWSEEKSNNALDSKSMDNNDAMGSGSMDNNDAMDGMSMDNNDDKSGTWSEEKSNNALNPGPTMTNDALNPQSAEQPTVTTGPLRPQTTGGPDVTNNALNPQSAGGPTVTNDALNLGSTGTNDALNPLSSGPTGTTGTNSAFRLESNITGNTTQDAEFINSNLAWHNRERALFGLPSLVWNATLAADAKAWAEYLGGGNTGGRMIHCIELPQQIWEQIEECKHHEGENIAMYAFLPTAAPISTAPKYMEDYVMSDKPSGHYLQVVAQSATSMGCGVARNTAPMVNPFGGDPWPPNSTNIISCRFYPPMTASDSTYLVNASPMFAFLKPQ